VNFCLRFLNAADCLPFQLIRGWITRINNFIKSINFQKEIAFLVVRKVLKVGISSLTKYMTLIN